MEGHLPAEERTQQLAAAAAAVESFTGTARPKPAISTPTKPSTSTTTPRADQARPGVGSADLDHAQTHMPQDKQGSGAAPEETEVEQEMTEEDIQTYYDDVFADLHSEVNKGEPSADRAGTGVQVQELERFTESGEESAIGS